MVRMIAVVASLVISLASLRLSLGLPPFGAWLNVPAWASAAGAMLWAGAAISAAIWKD